MKEYWKKNSGIIITILIVLAVTGIIWYFAKRSGKKYVPKDIVIPPDTQPNGTSGVYNPGPITDGIYEDLDEVIGVHESEPYTAAMKLSNSQLAAVYNDWNQRYAKDFDNKTIIQAIEGDFSAWNLSWASVVDNLLIRLRSLPGAQGRTQN